MISCVVVDDEEQNIIALKRLLARYCPEIRVVGEATTGSSAVEVIRREAPQLVLLDVEMPGMNAFDILAQLKSLEFEYILVTAFEGYALKAFAQNALHYLLKPVDVDELRLAVQKAAARIAEKTAYKNIVEPVTKIALPTANGLVIHAIEDIVCCTARTAYTLFEFADGKELLVSGSLKDYEEKLPSRTFCRVHNSHLINMDHVRQYIRGKGGQAKMSNGRLIDIAVRRKDEFLSRLR